MLRTSAIRLENAQTPIPLPGISTVRDSWTGNSGGPLRPVRGVTLSVRPGCYPFFTFHQVYFSRIFATLIQIGPMQMLKPGIALWLDLG